MVKVACAYYSAAGGRGTGIGFVENGYNGFHGKAAGSQGSRGARTSSRPAQGVGEKADGSGGERWVLVDKPRQQGKRLQHERKLNKSDGIVEGDS